MSARFRKEAKERLDWYVGQCLESVRRGNGMYPEGRATGAVEILAHLGLLDHSDHVAFNAAIKEACKEGNKPRRGAL